MTNVEHHSKVYTQDLCIWLHIKSKTYPNLNSSVLFSATCLTISISKFDEFPSEIRKNNLFYKCITVIHPNSKTISAAKVLILQPFMGNSDVTSPY